jgi:lambda family phage tail tape measure protein
MGDKQVKLIITAFANQAEAELKRFGGVATKLGGVLAAAFSVQAITSFAKASIDAADQMSKMSQSAGVSVEQLSSLGHAANLADVPLESLGKSLGRLAVGMADTLKGTGEAKDAFQALGISVTTADGNLRSSDDVLKDIAERFAGMEDGAGKTALAIKIFGRSGAALIPLLNAGAAGLADMQAEAAAMGLTLSTETAQAAEQFNDNLTRMKGSLQGVANQILAETLPTLNKLSDSMVENAKSTNDIVPAAEAANTALKVLLSVGLLMKTTYDAAAGSLNTFAVALLSLVKLDLSGAWSRWQGGWEGVFDNAKENVERITGLWEKVNQSGQRFPVPPPPKTPAPNLPKEGKGGKDKAAEAAKRLAEEWQKTRASLTLDTAKLGMDEFEQKVVDLAVKVQELREKFGPSEVIDNWFAAQLKQIDVERIKQATEETKKLAEAQRAAREDAIKSQLAAVDLAERERSITREDAGQKRIALQRELLELQQRYQNQIDKLKDPAGWYAQQDAINGTRAALVDLNDEMQRLTGSETEGMARGFANYTETARTEFENGVKLAEDTASAMEGTFETVFFDGMRGQFESLGDYVDAFLRSMQQSVAQVLAQMATNQLINFGIGALGGAMGGGVGGATAGSSVYAAGTAPTAGSAFLVNAKGNAFDRGRVTPFARGGVVVKPTIFPMANGAGLMGEAGPEGILPLQRVGGKLGVTAAGLGSKQTVINSRPTYNIVTNNPSDVRRAIGQETARQARMLKAADRRNN